MNVNKHERPWIITLIDTNKSKGTTCGKKGYECKEHERLSNITLIDTN
jgi:hypothetical protein